MRAVTLQYDMYRLGTVTTVSLGERLRKCREAKGWSQSDVAERVGWHFSTIAAWERDERSPNPKKLTVLADLYNVSTDYLLGRTEDPSPQNRDPEDDIPLERRILRAAFDSGELGDLSEEDLRYLERHIRAAKQAILEEARERKEKND